MYASKIGSLQLYVSIAEWLEVLPGNQWVLVLGVRNLVSAEFFFTNIGPIVVTKCLYENPFRHSVTKSVYENPFRH